MKKTTFWALLFTAFTSIHCFGQPLSNIYSYPSEQGTNLHIRSLNAGKDLIYHCTNTIYHNFLCQPDRFYFSNLNMNMYKYTIPLLADINGGVNYTVADMHVVGNVCYICGKMTSTVGSHWGGSGYVYDYEDNGYFARIDLDSISKVFATIHPLADSTSRSLQPSPNIKISFCKLPYTKEVSKMCVSVSGGDTLIALVGRSSDSPAGPCLTALKKNATNWKHQWIKVDDPLEYFTDVVFTSKSPTLWGCVSSTSRNSSRPTTQPNSEPSTSSTHKACTTAASNPHGASTTTPYTWLPSPAIMTLFWVTKDVFIPKATITSTKIFVYITSLVINRM